MGGGGGEAIAQDINYFLLSSNYLFRVENVLHECNLLVTMDFRYCSNMLALTERENGIFRAYRCYASIIWLPESLQ